MAINYTWDCKDVRTETIDGKTDVVTKVHWRLTGVDSAGTFVHPSGETKNNKMIEIGIAFLDTSDLSSFKDFDSLTTSDTQGWVETLLGADKVAELKAGIKRTLDQRRTSTEQRKEVG